MATEVAASTSMFVNVNVVAAAEKKVGRLVEIEIGVAHDGAIGIEHEVSNVRGREAGDR